MGKRARGGACHEKARGYDLNSASHEAPCPWHIGGRDDSGIHVLDANWQRVATIWTTPSRRVSTPESVQALATRLRAIPGCRFPFDVPSRTQRHFSATFGVVKQPNVIGARKRDEHAHVLHWQVLKWRKTVERSGLREGQRVRLGALKHARHKELTLPA